MPDLHRVKLTATVDEHPMLDHLGEYSNEPGPDEKTIDRRRHGDMGRNEKRYFIARYPSYALENYERMEKFTNGHLSQYIIRAVASVDANGWQQELTSPGLGGIPSDSPTRAEDAAGGELRALSYILDAYNVDYDSSLSATWTDDAPFSGTITLGET